MERHGHRKAEARHIRLHRLAFDKLRRRPELIREVLRLLDHWLSDSSMASSRQWLEEWRDMLVAWPIEKVAALVLDDEAGQILRQCSPLAPALTPRERWEALAEVNASFVDKTETAP